jgi:hypothetical protein
MPLKRHYPDIRFSGNLVTPDEIDRYEQYQVINPAISATFFGSATAGTVSQAVTVGLGNTVADYPRNVDLVFTGSASVSGTATVTGKDQFGASITETISQAQGTQEAAVVSGTKVFAEVSACTVAMGTGVVGTGTVSLGVGTVEGKVKFGLPAKIGAVTDVKAITWSTESGVPTVLNGGTVASTDYVDTTNHAFLGSAALEGTTVYSVLFKPSYVAESTAKMANL